MKKFFRSTLMLVIYMAVIVVAGITIANEVTTYISIHSEWYSLLGGIAITIVTCYLMAKAFIWIFNRVRENLGV